MYKTYDKLLFFSISKILSLHKILLAADVSSIDKIVHEIGFLFKNDPEAIRKLKTAVKVIIIYCTIDYSVGKFSCTYYG